MNPIHVTIVVDPRGQSTIELPPDAHFEPGRHEAILTVPEAPRPSVRNWLPLHPNTRLVEAPGAGPPTLSREEIYGDDGR